MYAASSFEAARNSLVFNYAKRNINGVGKVIVVVESTVPRADESEKIFISSTFCAKYANLKHTVFSLMIISVSLFVKSSYYIFHRAPALFLPIARVFSLREESTKHFRETESAGICSKSLGEVSVLPRMKAHYGARNAHVCSVTNCPF